MSNRTLFTAPYKYKGQMGKVTAGNAGETFPTVNINDAHTLVVQDYDHQLYDYLQRNFSIGVMCRSNRASGFPHTWNEQKLIPSNTTAVDPRIGNGKSGSPDYRAKVTNTDYGRNNWQNALPRLHISGITYDFFDRKMQEEYGSFDVDLIAKDNMDMFTDYTRTISKEFWNGKATSLVDESNWEYMGILKQIKKTYEVPEGSTMAEALRSKIAEAMAQTVYIGMPTVIAMNPVTYDLLCKEEAKNEHNLYYVQIKTDIIPGVEVPAIHTQAGTLPIILTPWIEVDTTTSPGSAIHKIVALNTDFLERVWLFYDHPVMFVTQDPNNPIANPALAQDKNLMNFDTYILHGDYTPAHFILTKKVTTAGE